MNKISFLVGFAFISLLISQSIFALEYGCQVMPTKAVSITDKLIKKFYEKSQREGARSVYLPNIIPINTEIQHDIDMESKQSTGTLQYEAILRAKKSDYFHILHLILFKLERTRHLMYVCLNQNSEKPDENHLTIYFMLAYGLEPQTTERDNLSTLPGDWLFGPGGLFHSRADKVAQITRIPVELVPLHHLTDDVSDWTENVPLVDGIFKIPGTALKFSGVLLSRINEKLGAGVERIVVTPTEIEFANSVDLEHPEDANVIYRLNLADEGLKVF